jgi:hypothetical protein
MPKKSEKWGIKFWVLADSTSKFIYFFEVYCGKNLEVEVRFEVPRGEGGAAYGVVMRLVQGLKDKGHCVVMDNFFCSMSLFKDLASKGIYATGTVCSNCIGIPSQWAMHDSRGLSCIMWKDKCPILLISTHALPISFPCVPWDEVPHRNGAMRDNIPTSPILLEYTTFMRGIDVADQLRASYSSLTLSHKWWHRVFFAMLDIAEVNSYIMYLSRCAEGPNLEARPMKHLQFKTVLSEALLDGWRGRNERGNEVLTDCPTIHMPSSTHLKRLCVVYKLHTPHTYCFKCNFKFMCLKGGCYQCYHEALARSGRAY